MKQKTKLKISDVTAHWGLNFGSDHYLIKAIIIFLFTISNTNMTIQIRNENDIFDTIKIPIHKIDSLEEENINTLY